MIPAPPGLDAADLRARLTAAAAAHTDPLHQRTEAVSILKQALWTSRAEARAWLDAGADGLEVARHLSRGADTVIAALHAVATTHVIRARNPTEGERFALLALGGYGRGVLAPYSDVDVLMLRAWKPTPHVESVAEYLVAFLWDLGFKVGWAARSVDECLRLARSDLTVRTSLLERRLIAGDAALLATLDTRVRAEVVEGTAGEFVRAKLAERDERHARAGASRYLVEPDVKNGKGGRRDLHTLFWIARYLRTQAEDAVAVAAELFSAEHRRAFDRAFRVLGTVRCRLHFAAGRAEERLGFQHQAQVAAEMGYRPRGRQPAVERFMRRYFLAVREAGVLTRILCAQLEEGAVLERPRGLSRFLLRPRSPLPLRERAFRVQGGRLHLRRPDAFQRDPAALLRLFRLADRHDLDLAPETFDAVRRSGRLAARARRHPKAARTFLEVLGGSRDPRRVLTLMNEADLLGRFVPEFGRIVARTQFNMYHADTVDEHTLRAVGVLRDIAEGRAGADSGAPEAFVRLRDPDAVFLAMLLHDTGKATGEDQEVAGARFAEAACRRLGLEDPRTERVVWLVRHHLLLSDTAQKRDLGDPATVAEFTAHVGDAERLDALLAITVADIEAVGPGVLNGWKARLLRDLHQAAHRSLVAPDAPVGPAPSEPADALSTFDAPERDFLARAAAGEGAAVAAFVDSGRQVTVLAVRAPDRLGLFADLAAAIASVGAQVLGARAHTSDDGVALDAFYLQDAAGAPFAAARPERLRQMERAIAAAAAGTAPIKTVADRRVGVSRASAFDVAGEVRLEDLGARRGVRLEVSAADRPGLLSDLARAVADAGLSIRSAHVDTLGERAVDVLYLRRPDGARVQPGQLSRLRAAAARVGGQPASAAA